MATLVIDTSFGSAVAVVGFEPIIETDSRTHVEQLSVNIARAVRQADCTTQDIQEVIVGIGPAPFTGLRAGIVAAKAISLAKDTALLGLDILSAQAAMIDLKRFTSMFDEVSFLKPFEQDSTQHITLSINDARRKQVYAQVFAENTSIDESAPQAGISLMDMDIDYPENIVDKVNAIVADEQQHTGQSCVVDVIGHGAKHYADVFSHIHNVGAIVDANVFDAGIVGVQAFANMAFATANTQ
ncbi:MAG: tRNA (adenosine(37)-N6)-threonylcarbamoyltransferase complex dimerization subunit type 1 TsaB, partial [Bifidobacteriaceae bacterium]|nr:tRNA (adenosine(37)-N6)-threonylcarbamoyltransferase complex dimerization subunit type 1 TsaB [Bifidobacteriaceae bacterium]